MHLFLKPKTGGDNLYENHRQKCAVLNFLICKPPNNKYFVYNMDIRKFNMDIRKCPKDFASPNWDFENTCP